MITVHHLNNSRSQRVIWFLEELGLPYEIKAYDRNAETMFAPPELKEVHPLGKAPVIEDDGLVIAESGAIIEYLAQKHGKGAFAPTPGSEDYVRYLHWMHFAEGSAMLPVLLNFFIGRLGEAGAPLQPRIRGELTSHLGYLSNALEGSDYLMGSHLTAADVMISFVLEFAHFQGLLGEYPALRAYQARYQARPAYRRAIERGGDYAFAG